MVSFFPLLELKYSNIKLLFPSSGDAAGFKSFCTKNRIYIPPSFSLTNLAAERLSGNDDCAILIAAKNNRGDPVVLYNFEDNISFKIAF